MNNLLLNERSLIYHLRQYRSKRRLHYFAETESTNEVAKKLCGDGKGLGAFVVSDCQTAGKGRSGRTFCSPKGTGVYISIVYEISGKEPNFDLLSSLAGLAVRDTLFNFFGFDCRMKWPNDIFAGGKKLGGVLAEMVPISDCGDRVAIVIGVGLNLAVAQERLPIDKSTSLQLVARNLPDAMVLRDAIAVRWVQGLRSRLADFEEDPHREAVRAREAMTPICWTLGKQCEAHFVDGTTLQGRAVALNDDASLTIEDQEGVLHRVSTADVGVLSK